MAEHKPQQPGNVKINISPGSGSIEIDGYPIDQFVTAMKVVFSAKDRKPVLLLDLLPSCIDITGAGVEMRGDFRDFLLSHGWRPPE